MTSEDNKCDRCGGFAGFETSPEGDPCLACHRWLCTECIDWAAMRELYGSNRIAEDDCICLDCAAKKEYQYP